MSVNITVMKNKSQYDFRSVFFTTST